MKKSGKLFNPFPGLRPFRNEESHLFFGRKGQSEAVMENLVSKRFVAVIGASGSGKSSLIFCGLLPLLEKSTQNTQWQVVHLRPGNEPVGNLAAALNEELHGNKQNTSGHHTGEIRKFLDQGPTGLVDYLRTLNHSKSENFLVLIDQFEELFRYRSSRKNQEGPDESELFVQLLVEAVRQTDEPVYVVLTMRSDFIGECSRFQELTGLINNSNYLVPQMTREDFREAITGPVAVGGAKIDEALVQQLLVEVGDDPDQLPILQHAMMRTWDYWAGLSDPDRPVGLSDYEAVGTMKKALSIHANEAFDELSLEGKQVCEHLFKTITEKGNDNRGIRHPTRVEVIAEIAKTDIAGVIAVADTFRSPGRSFIVPAQNIDLDRDSVIDLSHESLMRIWDRLRIWVEEEAQAVNMYLRLAEAARMYQEGKTGLWRPPDLQLALNWKMKQQPTLTWAQRYDPAFERAMVYLETSEKEFHAEEENKIRMQRRALRRTRITALVLGVAAILSIGFMLFALDQRVKAEKQRLFAVEKQAEAEKQTKLAQDNFNRAEMEKAKAEKSAEEARRQKEAADSAKIVAQEQQKVAELNANIAKRQTKIANNKTKEAEAQRQIALTNEKIATMEREKATNLRFLSIAKSMSVKSQQIDDDIDLKNLLAYQAYLFNRDYGGTPFNADIYTGLYFARKSLDSLSYNIFNGHSDAVNDVLFLDNYHFITSGSDGTVRKWDIRSPGNHSGILLNDGTINYFLALSSDKKWLACGTGNQGIILVDLNHPGQPPKSLNDNQGKIKALAFSPVSGQLYSAGTDTRIVTWNPETGIAVEFDAPGSIVNTLAFSPSGEVLAAGTRDGRILLYDPAGGNPPTRFYQEQNNPVHVLTFNHQGNLLLEGNQLGIARIWDLQTKNVLNILRGHTARITDAQFSNNDSLILTSSMDGTIQLWDANDLNTQPVTYKDNDGFVFAVAFSQDNQSFVSGSTQGDYVVARPTHAESLVQNLCSNLHRTMTHEEWAVFVGKDIRYENTCPDLQSSTDVMNK
ncbi:MAG: hypothetical protein GXO83_07625 [Chlorobi bacterium]|nr:hypothetical protein [Chlorobiota bacterium]